MNKLTQREQVESTMRANGGMATLGFLYQKVDVSKWETKTPFASIRRILQVGDSFFKIKPGLWGLSNQKEKIITEFGIAKNKSKEAETFNHSYFQGLIVEIGNLKGYSTFIPNQDKNKKYLKSTLKDLATLDRIYEFTYSELMKRAKTVDTIWFNERKMPFAFFEIEHSTDINNSLIKFAELQDFYSRFNIVGDSVRKREFESKLHAKVFTDIRERVKFISYEQISEIHSNLFKYYSLQREVNL